jgi:hypothetical protein
MLQEGITVCKLVEIKLCEDIVLLLRGSKRGHNGKPCKNILIHFYISPDIRVNKPKRIKWGSRVARKGRTEIYTGN